MLPYYGKGKWIVGCQLNTAASVTGLAIPYLILCLSVALATPVNSLPFFVLDSITSEKMIAMM